MRIITVRPVAQRNRRKASELARIGRRQQITETAYRLNDIDAELFANAPDEYLDRVGVAVEILIVEMLDRLGARAHASGMMHQIRQQPVFVRGELDRIAVDRDAAGTGIEADRPASEFAFGVTGRAAQQRAHPREDLFEMKRLGDIVVGAGIETLHLVAPAIARREDQDRHGAPGAPPGFQHRDTILLRKADVEDDSVVGLALAEIMPLLAIEGAVYDVAGVGQRSCKLPVEIRIVFNNEKAQTTLRLTLADDRALDGVHNDAGDFAIMTEHCQHIGEAFAAMTQARAHQCTRHARTHGAQGCGKMQHSALLDQRPALLWVE